MERIAIDMSPSRFYKLVEAVRSWDASLEDDLVRYRISLENKIFKVDDQVEGLQRANDQLLQEVRLSTLRKRNPFESLEKDDPFAELRHSRSGKNFLMVAWDVSRAIQDGWHSVYGLASSLVPGQLMLSEDMIGKNGLPKGFNQIQQLSY